MSKKYLAIGVAVLAVGGAGLAFALSGGAEVLFAETGYEAAERGFINQFVNLQQPDNHVHVGLRYTNNLGMLSGMLGFDIPQLVELGFSSTAVGNDSITDVMVRLDETDFAVQLAQVGSTLFTAFPGVSDYFFEAMMMDADSDVAQWQEVILSAITLAPQLLDVYFEQVYAVTEREEDVSHAVGGLVNISMTGDMYSITFNQGLVLGLLDGFILLAHDEHPGFSIWLHQLRDQLVAADLDDETPLAMMHVGVADGSVVTRDIVIHNLTRHLLMNGEVIALSDVTVELSFRHLHEGGRAWFELDMGMITPDDRLRVGARGLFNHMGQGFNGALTLDMHQLGMGGMGTLFELNLDLSDIRRSNNGHLLGTISHSNSLQGINFILHAELSELAGNQAVEMTGQAGMFGFNMDLGVLALTWYTDHVGQLVLPSLDENFRILAEFGVEGLPVPYDQRMERLAEDWQAVFPNLPGNLAQMIDGVIGSPGTFQLGGN